VELPLHPLAAVLFENVLPYWQLSRQLAQRKWAAIDFVRDVRFPSESGVEQFLEMQKRIVSRRSEASDSHSREDRECNARARFASLRWIMRGLSWEIRLA
jgi:hypothetical protein